jgi:ADP-ribose pyrophosphatase YjhB (NUDIX family)
MIKMISEWIPSPFVPPIEFTVQSSGVCFTDNGNIILVNDGKNWLLPGGAPEGKERLVETLIREVSEEACSNVMDCQYIGCIRNEHQSPVGEGCMPVFYKARFWARVKKERFNPQFEIKKRIEIQPDQFLSMLSWNARKTADEILEDALLVENAKSVNSQKL